MSIPIKNEDKRIIHLPVTNILPSPYQPKTTIDMPSLRMLAKSIEAYGILQPITVRIINGRTYELVNGERRWRAAKLAGLSTIPAIVVNVSDSEAAILAIIENTQNQELNFFEEAKAYEDIMEDYDLSIDEMAEKTGQSPMYISNKLKLLSLPDSIKKLIIENKLSENHAHAFLKIPTKSVLEEVVLKTINEELGLKKTELLIENTLKDLCEPGSESALRKKFGDVRIISNTAKKAVELMKRSGVKANYDVDETEEYFKITVTIPYK